MHFMAPCVGSSSVLVLCGRQSERLQGNTSAGCTVPCNTFALRIALCRGADLPTALTRVSMAWLVSQPVAAAQLVLVTAAEGKSLVPAFGDLSFAAHMPLAASGEWGQAWQHVLWASLLCRMAAKQWRL